MVPHEPRDASGVWWIITIIAGAGLAVLLLLAAGVLAVVFFTTGTFNAGGGGGGGGAVGGGGAAGGGVGVKAAAVQPGQTPVRGRYTLTADTVMEEPVIERRIDRSETVAWYWNTDAGTASFIVDAARRPLHSVDPEPTIVTSEAQLAANTGLHVTLVDGGEPPQSATINGTHFVWTRQSIAGSTTITLIAFIGRDEVRLTGSFTDGDRESQTAIKNAVQSFRVLRDQ